MNYRNTIEFANELDAKDELSKYRNEFHIPLQKNGEEHIYMCGNLLGLQPKRTKDFINQELERLGKIRCRGSF